MLKAHKAIETVVRPTLSMLGEVKHEVVTQKSLKHWLVEIRVNGKTNQSQRVHLQRDVPLATRTMLRTEHLLGNFSAYTRAATQGAPRAGNQSRPIAA